MRLLVNEGGPNYSPRLKPFDLAYFPVQEFKLWKFYSTSLSLADVLSCQYTSHAYCLSVAVTHEIAWGRSGCSDPPRGGTLKPAAQLRSEISAWAEAKTKNHVTPVGGAYKRYPNVMVVPDEAHLFISFDATLCWHGQFGLESRPHFHGPGKRLAQRFQARPKTCCGRQTTVLSINQLLMLIHCATHVWKFQ
jgi:hypothetical protein